MHPRPANDPRAVFLRAGDNIPSNFLKALVFLLPLFNSLDPLVQLGRTNTDKIVDGLEAEPFEPFVIPWVGLPLSPAS